MKKRKSFLILLFLIYFLFPQSVQASEQSPDINGKYAITIDLRTNEIIYSKNIDTQAYPASVTKLLTAVIFAENFEKDDTLVYSRKAQSQEPTSYTTRIHYLSPGETMTAENAMDSLLLKSCNDIAYMIAENTSESSENFADLMNSTALALNMKNSHFVTPNGLDTNIDNHLSTAYDISQLLIAAYNTDWVRETINKKTSTVKSVNTPEITIKNTNKLLSVDGCIGGKTGFTTKAGRCLSTIFERDGRLIGGVILNSQVDWPYDTRIFNDMKEIIDWSYNAKKDVMIQKNTVIDNYTVKYKLFPLLSVEQDIEVPLEIKQNVTYYDNGYAIEKNITINDINPLNLNKNVPVGTLTITQRDSVKKYDLFPAISSEDLFKQNFIAYNKNRLSIMANNKTQH